MKVKNWHYVAMKLVMLAVAYGQLSELRIIARQFRTTWRDPKGLASLAWERPMPRFQWRHFTAYWQYNASKIGRSLGLASSGVDLEWTLQRRLEGR
jgi:hypothetical protein